MDASDCDYLHTYGIDTLMQNICQSLAESKPERPLDFIVKAVQEAQSELPEVSNVNAADPGFWINYWETNNVTWQAPVVSPWLKKHTGKLFGTTEKYKQKQRTVFVPLCGKSINMKYLLDWGFKVIGAK